MKIKAIIFDLDGTLVDSEKPYRKIWTESFNHFGYELTHQHNLDLMSLGEPYLSKTLYEWYGKTIDFASIEKYALGLEKKYYQTHKLKVKKGVKKALAYLKSQGFTLAVATATVLPIAIERLKKVDLFKYFEKVISAANIKRGKPSGDVYRLVLKQLKLKPNEAVAVEDSPNGLSSANDAKIFTILIPDMAKPNIDKNNKLVKVIDSANELCDVVKDLNA